MLVALFVLGILAFFDKIGHSRVDDKDIERITREEVLYYDDTNS